MVSDGFRVCGLLVAAAPLTLWLHVLSLDDHPVLDLVAQEHNKDSIQAIQLTSASLHSVVSAYCPSFFSLELCLQLCIHKLSKLIALCFLAVRVLNSNVKRKRASEHSLSSHSATRCMSSRHRGQLSVAVGVVTNSSRSDLVFTKALLSCVPLSPRDCSDNSTGSHIFDSAWRLSSQRRISTA